MVFNTLGLNLTSKRHLAGRRLPVVKTSIFPSRNNNFLKTTAYPGRRPGPKTVMKNVLVGNNSRPITLYRNRYNPINVFKTNKPRLAACTFGQINNSRITVLYPLTDYVRLLSNTTNNFN